VLSASTVPLKVDPTITFQLLWATLATPAESVASKAVPEPLNCTPIDVPDATTATGVALVSLE
jgi:hypothetical protein